MDKNKNIVFVLGDKLPLTHEVVTSIVTFAPGGKPTRETSKRTIAINAYVIALIELWIKAFGYEHVQARRPVAYKIRSAIKSYNKEVVNVAVKSSGNISRRERLRR